MNEPINCSLPIYFYDDRNKYDSMMKLTQVLYQDEDTCVCIANWTAPHIAEYTTKLMFNIADGQVINSDYNSWIATNDVAWAEEEDARIQLRSARGMTNEGRAMAKSYFGATWHKSRRCDCLQYCAIVCHHV